jgi:hypothetical protein
VRQAAKILDRENQKLTQKVTDLTRELMALRGEDRKSSPVPVVT